jgi:tetratricopeptide (TPR) repeat protein
MDIEIMIKSAREAFVNGDLELTLKILDNEKLLESAEACFLRGEAFYKSQKFGDSLNNFKKVLEINPENENAQTYVDMINNILNFYHKELYNP